LTYNANKQTAIQDNSQNRALLGHSGTAGTAVTKRVVIDPTSGYLMKTDPSTEAAITINYEHHELHDGSHFFVQNYGTFAADGDIDFQVTTPNTTKWTHMLFEIDSTGATVFTIYEGAAVGTATAVTAQNSNRNGTTASTLAIQADGAVNTAGSAIYAKAFGYTNTPSKTGAGQTRAAYEIILKQNTTYRFFIESNSADNIISYGGFWYEHANKH